MGLLVEAGDGYRAQPNVTVRNNRIAREGTAALPYAENLECGTDKFNEIRLIRTRAVRHNVSRQTPIGSTKPYPTTPYSAHPMHACP